MVGRHQRLTTADVNVVNGTVGKDSFHVAGQPFARIVQGCR